MPGRMVEAGVNNVVVVIILILCQHVLYCLYPVVNTSYCEQRGRNRGPEGEGDWDTHELHQEFDGGFGPDSPCSQSTLGVRSLEVASLTIVLACLGPWLTMAVDHMGLSSFYRLVRVLPSYTTNQCILLLVWASTSRFIQSSGADGPDASSTLTTISLKSITVLSFVATLIGCAGWLAPLMMMGGKQVVPHVRDSWAQMKDPSLVGWSGTSFFCDALVTILSIWYIIHEGYEQGVGRLWKTPYFGDSVADRVLERRERGSFVDHPSSHMMRQQQ